MEWFVFAAPVPGPVDFGTGGSVALLAMIGALVPVVLAARHLAGAVKPKSDTAPLRVIEGGKEPRRRAA